MTDGMITHARVVLPDSVLSDATVVIRGGRIASLLPAGATGSDGGFVVDAGGDWLIPGLVDLHVHGAGGFDTMDGQPQSLAAMARTLAQAGTTAFLATTMSAPPAVLAAVLAAVSAAREAGCPDAAEILGVHMEGPFLAAAYKGAQAAAAIYPLAGDAAAAFAALAAAHPGLIRILTFAVERPGAERLAALCADNGIIAAVGHSEASYEAMREAVKWGVRQVTHAFNAMPGIHHRRPGLLTEALNNPAVRLELIADGVHIHPAVLRLALSLKPEAGVLLVSDGTRAVGMADGDYELGGQMTTVSGGTATLADGTIAGSAYPLLQGIRTLVSLGFTLPQAVNRASLYPARLLGVDNRLGSIAAGKEASLVRLGAGLQLRQVWRRGVLLTERGG
ncbi:MAG: N-acetylglucosamine-6-phosphate deacetylase [Sporomusaceae bacterium]|nr:N-acetylglucosamine-6-phosphate deacetylase [Sporomusaceae bacterium]